jgi:cytochrome c nitrite reductase small subunit
VRKLSSAILLLGTAGAAFLAGFGGFTFQYAQGHSYLSDDPAACVNCHVMREQFESWSHSSHRNWATCNDCHTPKGFVDKYFTKALNGWNHSVKFTTMNFPEPIRINERNRGIAMTRCMTCHETAVLHMGVLDQEPAEARCVECHGNPGHQTRGGR